MIGGGECFEWEKEEDGRRKEEEGRERKRRGKEKKERKIHVF